MSADVTRRKWRVASAGLMLALGVIGGYFGRFGLHLQKPHANPSAHVTPKEPEVDEDRVTRPSKDKLHIPASVAAKMGLRTATAGTVKTGVNLPNFQGVLALDNDRLSRVHARFGGEVVELGKSTDGSDPTLRVGERVHQGDLLAVIWSTELGEKKSELVDALAKLRAEEQLRDRLKKLFEEGAGAGRTYRDAEKDVQARRVGIASLERTLRTWRVTSEDIEDVHAEVEHLANERSPAVLPGDWSRVEVRAPMSGIILEKNLVVGEIVDTDTDLFKIGDLSQLVVWAHVYEEDLPMLESLPRPIPWTLTLPSQPGTVFPGTLDKIGAVIDPTQHTALVAGRVDNSEGHLKVGQFVTASVKLPPADNEIELPSTAVVEDGTDSIVFVQPNLRETDYVRRTVHIVRRLRETVYIKSVEAGVRPGDRIVTSGALMLQNAMAQLPSEEGRSSDVAATAPHQHLRAERSE